MGHFGHVKLGAPVLHIGYLRPIISILQAICKRCSHLLLPADLRLKYLRRLRRPDVDLVDRKTIFADVIAHCKRIKSLECQYCSFLNGSVKVLGTLKLVHFCFGRGNEDAHAQFLRDFEYALKHNQELEALHSRVQEQLDPMMIQELFRRIPPEDIELLDMSALHALPPNLIFQYMPVPPVSIRPSVQMGLGQGSNEDDLTVKISQMLIVSDLMDASVDKGQPVATLLDHWERLQLVNAKYYNSDQPGIPALVRDPNPTRSLCQRLKGKQGRFRQNLSGKRVDFSARTVISPDPNLAIDEVGVPLQVATNMTYPERAFAGNIARLRRLVVNGTEIHPGANFVEYADGSKIFLRFARDRSRIASNLRIGDIVHRHLCNGDLVLFNRQPSLHRVSIMCHRARVMPGRTLRFNECCCTPYNADFDGDEMNLHLPQTEEARAEAMCLLGVPHNLITPRSGEPLVAATQDFLTSSYLFSLRDRFFDRTEFSRLACYMSDAKEHVDLPRPAVLRPVELWTGKQLLSVLLSSNVRDRITVNLEFPSNKLYDKSSKQMCASDGYVYMRNSELLSGILDKKSLGGGSKHNLFHVLLRDHSPERAARIMSRLAKVCARWLGEQGFSIGIADVQPSTHLEEKKAALVNAGYAQCAEIIDQFRSGQLTPLPGCTLDQTLESVLNGELSQVRNRAGELCKQELSRHNAPLIMTLCGSKGSEINISQMVAIVGQQTVSGGRICDGFHMRTLPHFSFGARDPAAKGFVQNSFYSGLTPTEFFFHTMAGREGLIDTAVKTAETGYMQRRLMKALEDLSIHYDATVRTSNGGLVQFHYGDDGLDPAHMEGDSQPVEMSRVFHHTQVLHPNRNEASLQPEEIAAVLEEILCNKDIDRLLGPGKDGFRNHFRKFFLGSATGNDDCFLQRLQSAHAHCREGNLQPGTRLYERTVDNLCRVTRGQLDALFEICLRKYTSTICEPGTAVGAIGAQSIGEPCTQMTLKTFHFAGVASMNITLGVPRIKEIIDAVTNISTPIITAKLIFDSDPVAARIVKGRIEHTKLGGLARTIREVFRKNDAYVEVVLDLDLIERLHLDVSVSSVRQSILDSTQPRLKLKPQQVMAHRNSIRCFPASTDRQHLLQALGFLKRNLAAVTVHGFPGIERAVVSQYQEKPPRYELAVEGSNLLAVMGTPGINAIDTTSNSVMEVFATLGIEAARATIVQQIHYTVGSHGINVDLRHLILLAETMTFKGRVLGITRHGVAKMKSSVLMLASFETPTAHLFDAAVHGRSDTVVGVSESIILGNAMPIGTGIFKILQDVPPLPAPTASFLLS